MADLDLTARALVLFGCVPKANEVRLGHSQDCAYVPNGCERVAALLTAVRDEERARCLDWCGAFSTDDGTAQKIADAIRGRQ